VGKLTLLGGVAQNWRLLPLAGASHGSDIHCKARRSGVPRT